MSSSEGPNGVSTVRATSADDSVSNLLIQVNTCLTVARGRSRYLNILHDGLVLWMMMMWLLAVVLLVASAAALETTWKTWLMMAMIPLSLVMYGIGRQWRIRITRARLAAQAATLSVPELAGSAFQMRAVFADTMHLRELLRTLVTQGRVGVTIRASAPWHEWPVIPLEASFEPRQLKQSELQSDELFLAPMREQVDESRWPEALRCLTGKAEISRQLSYWSKRCWPAVLLIVVVLLLGMLVDWVYASLLATCFLVAGAMYAVFGAASRDYLVPGGLVVRAKWWGKHRLFDRRQCALGAVRIGDDLWDVVIADTQAGKKLLLGDVEVMALLMAWLSPLEPPTAEQLDQSL